MTSLHNSVLLNNENYFQIIGLFKHSDTVFYSSQLNKNRYLVSGVMSINQNGTETKCTDIITMVEYNLIIVQQDATYSVYYISVGSSTCFGCWHPSLGDHIAVITASVID